MQYGPKIQLADDRLGANVDIKEWVVFRRLDDRTWKWISDRLFAETRVRLTSNHLRLTFGEAVEAARGARAVDAPPA
jgi:hypothetical protein